ncbi:hypothetical protein DFQ29_003299, partial [Apophysomyces sp. BC1021]
MHAVESHHEFESNFVDLIDIVCSNNQSTLEKASKYLIGIAGTRKVRDLLCRGIDYNKSVKRKYEQLDSDSSLEPTSVIPLSQEGQDRENKEQRMEFILQYKKNVVGKMNWNKCLQAAHQKNLFDG